MVVPCICCGVGTAGVGAAGVGAAYVAAAGTCM